MLLAFTRSEKQQYSCNKRQMQWGGKILQPRSIEAVLMTDGGASTFINNKLQQPEAASGVLEYAMKHFGELEIQATWYEKLHEWEDALVAYDKKIDMNKEEPELILGRMRCLEALGEWYVIRYMYCIRTFILTFDIRSRWALQLWSSLS
ncbi:hypothetical protein ATANTOWER_016699 [Ataeniobius toweri]|uniref:Uncharacterized protein n=1 Tax=Ataeniobius toweri TaxID=208326 RepID=A0ABU7CHI1_9TELE|nr:hypothetical protein [Ataeniobius toweri]